jgi:hypothetical protein
MAQNIDPEVNLKVRIPKSLDRAIEAEVYKRDTTKKALVEQSIRAFLKVPARAA